VKTQREPSKGGGKGKLSLGWDFRDNSPAELICVVDLSSDSAWLFTFAEFDKLAQQHSSQDNLNYTCMLMKRLTQKKKWYSKANLSNTCLRTG